MPLSEDELHSLLDKIFSSDAYTFASSIKHLFNYVEENISKGNKAFELYEKEHKDKWNGWEESAGPSTMWSPPDKLEDTISLAYHLYKRSSETEEKGTGLTYNLYLESNIHQNIIGFNEFWQDYFAKAIENIMKNEEESSSDVLYKLPKIQKEYIQSVFDHFQEKGEWPIIRLIAQKFKGKSIKEIRKSLPRSLYIDDRKYCKLTLYGIFHAESSQSYKDAMEKIANLLKETIKSNPEQDVIHIEEQDISSIHFKNDNHRKEVFWMLGESWSEGHGESGSTLTIHIPQDTADIDSFTDAVSLAKSYYGRWDKSDEIDEIRIPFPITTQSEKPFNFSFMKSKKRQDIASQYIKGTDLAFSNSIPLSSTILYGAALECILLDLLLLRQQKVKQIKGKKVQELSLQEMVNVAHQLKLISKTSKDLGHLLRDYRNLIHPERCQREKIPEMDDAQTARHVFSVILNELRKLKKKRKQ